MNALTVRYMLNQDIPAVTEIDDASFDPPWSARSYRFEINESPCSYMLVLERSSLQPVTGLRKIYHNLRGQAEVFVEQPLIVGYGGLWQIQDEAHISTIASHPQFRGLHYGEVILASMIQRSIQLRTTYVLLEVRASNTVAQNLYRKYGFEVTGFKPRYYRNNLEDAYEMKLCLDHPAHVSRFHALYFALQQQVPFMDEYTDTPHPRLG